MIRSAAEPIATVVHERLLELGTGLGGLTVEQVALAIIAGAGRFLVETSGTTRDELEQRIVQVIAGDARADQLKTH